MENLNDNKPQEQKPKKQFFSLDSTRRVTYLAILIALAIVLKLFGIDLPSGKVSLFYIPCYLSGAFFGPFVGFTVGAMGDLIGFVIKGGTPNPIVTLGNGLIGFIVGIAFKMFPKLKPELRLIIGAYMSMFITTLGINTIGLAVLFNNPSMTLLQNYWAQLLYGTPLPRIAYQPIIITANLAITVGLYYVLNKYLARYLGISQEKAPKIV
ncbi:MAG TPA: folate family ECF transporter S component [Clostridia bacterium]